MSTSTITGLSWAEGMALGAVVGMGTAITTWVVGSALVDTFPMRSQLAAGPRCRSIHERKPGSIRRTMAGALFTAGFFAPLLADSGKGTITSGNVGLAAASLGGLVALVGMGFETYS